MSRSSWNAGMIEDLELRLAPSFLSKGGILASNFARGYPSNIITIDDNDDDEGDDVQIYSPGPSREASRSFPRSSSQVPALTEEDLELRLGIGAYFRYPENSNCGTKIFLDGIQDHAWKCGKRKCGQASSSYCTTRGVKEIKLRCAICMDTMKEETSTFCGHIFCKPCITNAVLMQKKCPTCRAKLSIQNIHRIYLPGTTS